MGLNIAKAIYRRYPKAIVHILEKESAPGMHTSGRNSGVIHAGIYYSTDSLKARFWKEGNKRLTKYCEDNNLELLKCGKFIVASNETEYEQLHDIYEQGLKNGIDVKLITRKEAQKIEPLLRGYGEDVIYSPSTSVANPKQVIHCISEELKNNHGDYCKQFYNVELLKHDRLTREDICEAVTKDSLFQSKYLINCAGQQALSIAQQYGFGLFYSTLPVKGNYLISNRRMSEVKTLVYPVPMKNTYFLGVHSTLTPSGHVKIGPSATPALSFENYTGLQNLKLGQVTSILGNYSKMLVSKQLRLISTLAFQELPKLSIGKMIESVRRIHDLDPSAFTSWYPPGIRAQLVDQRTVEFVGDFKLEYDGYSMHVLNAISPGWTCASPFSDYVVENISSVFKLK